MMWEAQSSSRLVSIQLQNSWLKFHLNDTFRSPTIASSSCCFWSWTRLTRSLRLSTSRSDYWHPHLRPQLHICTIFPHVLNLLMIGVDRLLQHALHSPPSQGGELQPNYVDYVPHHMPFVLSPRTLSCTIWSHNDPNRLPDLPTPGWRLSLIESSLAAFSGAL